MTKVVIANRRNLVTTGQLAYSSWFLVFGVTVWNAYQSHNYNLKENLLRGSLICILFLAFAGLNAAKRQPYTTAGTAPQFMRGIMLFYCCVLILVVSSNYDDAREIVSVFEEKPSEVRLKK